MTATAMINPKPLQPADPAEGAVALVRRWLAEAAKVPVDTTAAQLAGVLKDPQGLDFTVGFIDGVVRPDATLRLSRRKEKP